MNDFWNERYAHEEFAYGTSPNVFLQEEIRQLKPGRILFVCEGEGRNAVYASSCGWDVEAYDLSEEGRKKAMRLAKTKQVTIQYRIANAIEVEYPEASFDVVALIYAHFLPGIRSRVHSQITRWLKPQGRVILEAFGPLQLNNSSGGPKDRSMLYSVEDLVADFETLEHLRLSNEQIDLNEGPYHRGPADVVRLVALKK
jgi:ubiquinone/menaquinone biosynthesis C-methylase UbiE